MGWYQRRVHGGPPMKCLFVLLIAAACALAVEQISDETMFADVSNTIESMKKKGATEADCKDLAKTSCKEVSKERITDQKIINKQKTGRHCVTLGQKGVKKAEFHWKKTKKIHMSWKVKVTKAANFRVHFSSQRYASMKPGHCGFIFGSRSYLSARARYNRYTKIELQYRAANNRFRFVYVGRSMSRFLLQMSYKASLSYPM